MLKSMANSNEGVLPRYIKRWTLRYNNTDKSQGYYPWVSTQDHAWIKEDGNDPERQITDTVSGAEGSQEEQKWEISTKNFEALRCVRYLAGLWTHKHSESIKWYTWYTLYMGNTLHLNKTPNMFVFESSLVSCSSPLCGLLSPVLYLH